MAIKFACPKCGKRYSVDDKYAGSSAKCPCGYKILVPRSSEGPSIPTPSPETGVRRPNAVVPPSVPPSPVSTAGPSEKLPISAGSTSLDLAMDKREQTKRYFKAWVIPPFLAHPPKWAKRMIIIGLPCLVLPPLGCLLIGIGIVGLMDWRKQRPDDAQMDAWLDEDLKVLQGKALSKSGTDPSELVGEPVVVTGLRLWDIAGAEVAFKKGKDNVLRFTPVGVTVLNFTQNQLIIYSSVLDLTTGNALNESTEEYFYRDVVSVSTKTKSMTKQLSGTGAVKGGLKGPLQLNAAETFELTTSGGTSVEIVLRDPTLIEKMGGGDIPTTRAEKAIQTVRKMLREKKGAPA